MSKPIKQVTVKVFPPDGAKPHIKTHRAPPGRFYMDEGISELLMQYASEIEKQYPGLDFYMITVGKNAYNFLKVKTP